MFAVNVSLYLYFLCFHFCFHRKERDLCVRRLKKEKKTLIEQRTSLAGGRSFAERNAAKTALLAKYYKNGSVNDDEIITMYHASRSSKKFNKEITAMLSENEEKIVHEIFEKFNNIYRTCGHSTHG